MTLKLSRPKFQEVFMQNAVKLSAAERFTSSHVNGEKLASMLKTIAYIVALGDGERLIDVNNNLTIG